MSRCGQELCASRALLEQSLIYAQVVGAAMRDRGFVTDARKAGEAVLELERILGIVREPDNMKGAKR